MKAALIDAGACIALAGLILLCEYLFLFQIAEGAW